MSLTWADCFHWAAHWSQRWFLDPDGRDRILMPEGILGGWATHIEAHAVLLQFALDTAGLDIDRAERSLLGLIKQRGIDRAVRAWGLRAVSMGRATHVDVNPGGAALIVEIPTPSMMEPVQLVSDRLPAQERSLGVADPRAAWSWRSHGRQPALLLLGAAEERRAVRRGADATRLAFDAMQAAPPPMRFGGEDVSRAALEALRSSLSRSLPWLVPESLAVRGFLHDAQPRAIAVASDQHRIGRLTTHLAAGSPVVVLQHGLPQAAIGFLPVVADRVAVWSQASADWFVRHGTPGRRLVITGNPRLDGLRQIDRERERASVDSRLNLSGIPRLLLALSPTAVDHNRHALQVCTDALAALPAATLIIKLHPGHRSWNFVHAAIRTSPDKGRIRILQTDRLPSLLAWADVVLVRRSTVAAESLALGTPVVLVGHPDTLTGAGPEEFEELALPRIAGSPQGGEILADLTNPAGRERYFTQRLRSIERLNGPADGRAAERIARLLLDSQPGVPSQLMVSPSSSASEVSRMARRGARDGRG